MDSLRNPQPASSRIDEPESQGDLSALSWVHDELKRSLESAHKSLRKAQAGVEAGSESDVSAVDTSAIHSARQQIHQSTGALELVGLPAGAALLRACEAAMQRFISKPKTLNNAAISAIEGACFALLDYVARLLAGKQVSALALFPQYRAVQEAAGADRVHPADLWFRPWQWCLLPADAQVQAREPDATTRSLIESKLLSIMRNPNAATVQSMSDICAGLGTGSPHLQTSTLWKLAAAMYEAQSHDLLLSDVFIKRVASRLLAQLRVLERGGREVSERLAQDLLFFCAQARPLGDAVTVPRLASVRLAYDLAHHASVDYHASSLGRFDPVLIALARKRIAAAQESWSGVAGGELHRISGLTEQFSLAGESLARLFPAGDVLADELRLAALQTQQTAQPPSAPLAMEAATSLLYVDACLEDAEFDHPELGARVQRMAQRMASVRAGETPQPLEGWMESLYRRMSDRQTMGSVVQELRTSLSDVETLIDPFFRNPTDASVLMAVPGHLSSMRGVLSVLGMDHAASAVLRMREEVSALIAAFDAGAASDAARPDASTFDRLANNLGALGFLIDMLSVQPALAKTLFVYDAAAGNLTPVMGRSERGSQQHGHASSQPAGLATAEPLVAEPRLIEQAQMLAFSSVRDDVSIENVARDLERLSNQATAADQTALAATVNRARRAIEQAHDADGVSAARDELSVALAEFVHSSSKPQGLDTPATASREVSADALADDDEMREVFLEEAREVFDTARDACTALAAAPDDLQQLTVLRRAFHTLKGSARMVGLNEFGDAGWVCEQLYNTRLAEQRPADAALLAFTTTSLDQLAGWVDDIAASRATVHSAAAISTAAELLDAPPAAAPLSLAAPQFDQADPADVLPTLDVAFSAELEPIPTSEAFDASPSAMADFDFLAFDASETDARFIDAPASAPQAEHFTDAESTDAADFAPTRDVDFDFGMPALGASSTDTPAFTPAAPLPAAGAMFHLFDPQATQPMPYDATAEFAAGMPAADPDVDFDLLSLIPNAAVAGSAAVETATASTSFAADAPAQSFAENAATPAWSPAPDEDEIKVIGSLRIGIPLFNIYLNEADELSRRLCTELAEWSMELHRPVGDSAVALAHSLGGSSATVGFVDLSNLARKLDHALAHSVAIGSGTPDDAALFVDVANEIRHLLHQFAAGFLKEPQPVLLARLAEHERAAAQRVCAAAATRDAESVTDHESGFGQHIEPPAWPQQPRASAFAALPGGSAMHAEFGASALSPLSQLAPADALAAPADGAEAAAVAGHQFADDEDIDAVDAIDAELFPIFEEEAEELMGELANRMQEWARRPDDATQPAGAMRALHTLKGGARLAGAMRLGERVHRLEGRIEALTSVMAAAATADDIEPLLAHCDELQQAFEAVQRAASGSPEDVAALPPHAAAVWPVAGPSMPAPAAIAPTVTPTVTPKVAAEWQPTPIALVSVLGAPVAAPLRRAAEPVATAAAPVAGAVGNGLVDRNTEPDWSRFGISEAAVVAAPRAVAAASTPSVRVRAPLLDRLVNQAGEVSITRSRIASDVDQIKESLADLTDNLERLRGHLRDIEVQAEGQINSRMEAAKVAAESFDPLELDRFTRFQELTRMMAESVNDVATVQRTLQRALQSTEDELAAQARLTRELQDDLLRTRMVEFETLSDRLYRVVRLAAKETAKQVRLDIVGGSIEIDRGVLDRMTGAFEHLLRNCVSHGIESPDTRAAAHKETTGTITISVSQDGNEVSVEVRDDGSGLDLQRIRAKGVSAGLIAANDALSDADLANLIFAPGFSTVDKVTELAGRGVGMDVVRSEVNAIGGRIETATSAGVGTGFKLVLPLTTAVTQVVMVRCAQLTVGIPSTLVVAVRRAPVDEIDAAYASGVYGAGDEVMPFFWLGSLLQTGACSAESIGRTRQVLIVRSASQRVAVHVDEVVGNQEAVVKNLGPQLSRMPGLAGMTLMASGDVALIYNPVALATLYGASARAATLLSMQSAAGGIDQTETAAAVQALTPLVMVVDDSLTVRRVTERMLLREGYRVLLAKDGLDALEKLAHETPAIVLSDIEMPRMDGFDFVRNLRADKRLGDLPVIMITSRIAQKHRDYALQLGVQHYLGKPYSEEDLLALIATFTGNAVAV